MKGLKAFFYCEGTNTKTRQTLTLVADNSCCGTGWPITLLVHKSKITDDEHRFEMYQIHVKIANVTCAI